MLLPRPSCTRAPIVYSTARPLRRSSAPFRIEYTSIYLISFQFWKGSKKHTDITYANSYIGIPLTLLPPGAAPSGASAKTSPHPPPHQYSKHYPLRFSIRYHSQASLQRITIEKCTPPPPDPNTSSSNSAHNHHHAQKHWQKTLQHAHLSQYHFFPQTKLPLHNKQNNFHKPSINYNTRINTTPSASCVPILT